MWLGEFEMYKKIHVFRVTPGEDLLEAMENYCKENNLTSGVIVGIIGSLKIASINFLKTLAANYVNRKFEGPMEIACTQGSVAKYNDDIIVHVHLVVDNEKEARAGHLTKGSIVFSTAEVIIGELEEQLIRDKDDYTGLLELQ